jgi:hypothetical protein
MMFSPLILTFCLPFLVVFRLEIGLDEIADELRLGNLSSVGVFNELVKQLFIKNHSERPCVAPLLHARVPPLKNIRFKYCSDVDRRSVDQGKGEHGGNFLKEVFGDAEAN